MVANKEVLADMYRYNLDENVLEQREVIGNVDDGTDEEQLKQVGNVMHTVLGEFNAVGHDTVCLRGGRQKKFLFWANQWFYLVSLVQKIGDPSGAHQFLAFLPIFMAKNCPNLP